MARTYKYQSGIEILVILVDVLHIVLCRFSVVYCVEIESGIIGIDGLEERFESVLNTTVVQRLEVQDILYTERTTREAPTASA